LLIVDASAAVEFLLDAPAAAAVRGELQRAESLHAPHLIDLEVLSALRRAVSNRRINARRGLAAVEDLALMRLQRYPAGPLLRRIWNLRNSATPYDASYIALAEALGAPLLTTDRRMARSHGHYARIIVAEP
jgi:predicted nucleic acid-binding protein